MSARVVNIADSPWIDDKSALKAYHCRSRASYNTSMHAMLSEYWPHLAIALSVLNVALIVIFLPWVLLSKKEVTSTVAWCLLVLFVPLAGALLFWCFGHNYLLHRVRHQRGEHTGRRKQHPHPDEP